METFEFSTSILQIEYIIFSIVIVVAGTIGWFFRNRILKRQLNHARLQLEEQRSLSLNLQNEVSILRKKNLDPGSFQKKMDKVLTDLETQKSVKNEAVNKLSGLKSTISKIQTEKDEILTKLADINSDKAKLSQKKKLLEDENSSLRNKIVNLQEQMSKFESRAVHELSEPGPGKPPVSGPKDKQSTEKFLKKNLKSVVSTFKTRRRT